MQTMRLLATAAIAFVFLLSSCAGKKETDPQKLLQRKWTLHSDSTQFVLFFARGSENLFHARLSSFGSDTIHGKWNLDGANVQLTIDREELYDQEVDSVRFLSGPDGASVKLYQKENELARIENGKVIDPAQIKFMQIDTLSEFSLRANLNGEPLSFSYHPIIRSTEMSMGSLLRGLGGLLFLVALGYAMSSNKRKIDWKLIASGLILQLVFAIGVLKIPFIASFFEGISGFFLQVINFTKEGTNFLFASFGAGKIESPLMNFVIMVLPTVIFFSALTSLLFYWGILQRVVYGLAWVMKKTMRLSGAESMAAAGNIFLGQTEAPLLIKPYLSSMTRSEIMCLMTGGMATIAGGVLAAYVGFLGGDDPQQQLYFAKHLLAASVMSAPAAIVAAKLLIPETEEFNQEMSIPKERIGTNALEAITNGTGDGLRLAANVAAMLLVFIALIAMGNFIMKDMIGEWTGLNEIIRANTRYDGLTMQFIIGYACAPVAYLLGVPGEDTVLVGQLIGEKTILNEFYGYTSLGNMKAQGLIANDKSIIMATYVLCGFANFASIGIQIGGIGSLAPNKKSTLSQLGFKALIGGTMACMFTAVVVGMLM
jgi:CNT family concentrative nucleoside transporter